MKYAIIGSSGRFLSHYYGAVTTTYYLHNATLFDSIKEAQACAYLLPDPSYLIIEA